VLEGKSRPTHFRGVTTVVAKLLNMTMPHVAVFGQKDAQQAVVIRTMVKELNFPVEIVVGPIVREGDGLAMSSRNAYLSSEERAQSTALSRSIRRAEELVRGGERQSSVIIGEMRSLISAQSLANIDYISVAEYATLAEITRLHQGMTLLVSLAVRFGKTRLIDNTIVTIP
jgi:pantoate--beta-alanine ligase